MAPTAMSISPPPAYSSPHGAYKAEVKKSTVVKPRTQPVGFETKGKVVVEDFNPYHNAFSTTETEADRAYPFPELKPGFPNDITTAPYEPIHDVVDRGSFADPDYPQLRSTAQFQDLAVHIGTELQPLQGPSSLQLNDLSTAQKDELAHLVASRGVVVLRDQKLTPEQLVEFGGYFGAKERPLHQHPSSGVPRRRGLDEVHVVWHDENMKPADSQYTSTELWHADMSHETNSLGLTALYNITNPVHGGGDTLFCNLYGLYDAFSPSMQRYLESLSAFHSGVEQATGAAAAGLHIRRPPVENVHPLVRTHPVTGWKSIYANPAFTRSIAGVPKIESDRILNMLYDTMTVHPDLTIRVKWQTNTVVLWDNRIVNHSATFDHWRPDPSCRRHALRVASTAEIPSLTPNGISGKSRREQVWEEQGLDVEAMKERIRNAQRKGGFKD